jgi:hypothetical protein
VRALEFLYQSNMDKRQREVTGACVPEDVSTMRELTKFAALKWRTLPASWLFFLGHYAAEMASSRATLVTTDCTLINAIVSAWRERGQEDVYGESIKYVDKLGRCE